MVRFSCGVFVGIIIGAKSSVCTWDSKVGSTYDLRPLILKDSAYTIASGDNSCTPDIESSLSYTWNMCAPVPGNAIPTVCVNKGKSGCVLLWADHAPIYQECLVIGAYDNKNSDTNNNVYKLIDNQDPSQGISLNYPHGEVCEDTTKKFRSVSIDVVCANTPRQVVSAQSSSKCSYHLIMKSYYGCPLECPITKAGLCNSHGYCKYDNLIKQSYCYCNQGYTGNSCSDIASPDNNNHGSSRGMLRIQIGLLITLLIIALGLLAIVGYMVHQITIYRKEQQQSQETSSSSTEYAALSGGDTELIDTTVVRF